MEPDDAAAGERTNLDEVAEPVRQPEAATAVPVVGGLHPPDERVLDPPRVADLADERVGFPPDAKRPGPAAVAHRVRPQLVHGEDELRVVSPYVGGGFGSALRPQYHVFLAVLAARELRRSVRVAMTRQQMFTFGHRPTTWQRVRLGAAPDGALVAVTHEAVGETSRFEDFNEAVVNWSGLLYRCDNAAFDYKVAALDVYTPCDMRAPGATWGVFALECAMDELAVALGMDPLELRLKNYAERDQTQDLPFSSKALRECYREGA